jgi:hypothetical protein
VQEQVGGVVTDLLYISTALAAASALLVRRATMAAAASPRSRSRLAAMRSSVEPTRVARSARLRRVWLPKQTRPRPRLHAAEVGHEAERGVRVGRPGATPRRLATRLGHCAGVLRRLGAIGTVAVRFPGKRRARAAGIAAASVDGGQPRQNRAPPVDAYNIVLRSSRDISEVRERNRNCWGLVLKCYELRTRQHKMLKVKALHPSKHYFL